MTVYWKYNIVKANEFGLWYSTVLSKRHMKVICHCHLESHLHMMEDIVVATSCTAHLSWGPFRLWKMFTRICQWILGSLDRLFWKSIFPEILTGSFLRKSTFFIFGALEAFSDLNKLYLALEIPTFGGHNSKTFWSEQ